MAKLHLAQQILDIIYPVGSVYLSWNSTDPKNLFGGTWTRLSGGFLYGCVSSVGTGNGTGTATNSHTLTINQIPGHTHEIDIGSFANSGTENWNAISNAHIAPKNDQGTRYRTRSVGGGQGHNHNIPYIAVFAWRRTA